MSPIVNSAIVSLVIPHKSFYPHTNQQGIAAETLHPMPSSPIPITVSSSLSLAPDISNPTGQTPSVSHPGNNPVRSVTFLFHRPPEKSNNIPRSIVVVQDNFAEEETNQNSGNLKEYTSPYYRGLLANDLPSDHYYDFVGERHNSHAASSVTSTTTKASLASTILTKFQKLGNSCYNFKRSRKQRDDDDDYDDDYYLEPGQKKTASPGLSDESKSVTTTALLSSSSKNVTSDDVDMIGREEGSDSKEKPLRESVTESGTSHDVPKSAGEDRRKSDAELPPFEEVAAIGDKKISEEDEAKIREFLWADKYRPSALKDFMCNKSKANQLQDMARNGRQCGHFIFHGPAGVGKRTMIWALLREVFGSDAVQAREVSKIFHLKGEVVGSIEVIMKESTRHVEVNLSEVKGYEKHVIYDIMKENLHALSNKFSALPCKLPPDNCRATIFYGVDKLSTDAILYIQWLLERYKVCGSIFFCCEEISTLQAIKHLCTVVHLLPPSKHEVIDVLNLIAGKEGIELPIQVAARIAQGSKSNLRQAIRSFEATWRKHYPFKEDQQVLTGWEEDIANMAKKMVHEQSPKQLYMIRGELQNLIEHDVSPEFIFRSLVDELKPHLDDLLWRRVQNLYLDFNKMDESVFQSDKMMELTRGDSSTRDQFARIEEFIAKFMSCYKAESIKTAHHDDHDSEE